jgi:hypothetical protein
MTEAVERRRLALGDPHKFSRTIEMFNCLFPKEV